MKHNTYFRAVCKDTGFECAGDIIHIQGKVYIHPITNARIKGNLATINVIEIEPSTLKRLTVDKKGKAVTDFNCNDDDDDHNSPCWLCKYFLFPIGCMKHERDEEIIYD